MNQFGGHNFFAHHINSQFVWISWNHVKISSWRIREKLRKVSLKKWFLKNVVLIYFFFIICYKCIIIRHKQKMWKKNTENSLMKYETIARNGFFETCNFLILKNRRKIPDITNLLEIRIDIPDPYAARYTSATVPLLAVIRRINFKFITLIKHHHKPATAMQLFKKIISFGGRRVVIGSTIKNFGG